MTPKIKIALVGIIVALAIVVTGYLTLSNPDPVRIEYDRITLEVHSDFPGCLEFTADKFSHFLPSAVIITNKCDDELAIDELILIHSDRPMQLAELKVTLLQKEDYDSFNFQAEAQPCETLFKKKHGNLRACGTFSIPAGFTMKLGGEYTNERLKIKGHFKDGKSLEMSFRLYLNPFVCNFTPASIFT